MSSKRDFSFTIFTGVASLAAIEGLCAFQSWACIEPSHCDWMLTGDSEDDQPKQEEDAQRAQRDGDTAKTSSVEVPGI